MGTVLPGIVPIFVPRLNQIALKRRCWIVLIQTCNCFSLWLCPDVAVTLKHAFGDMTSRSHWRFFADFETIPDSTELNSSQRTLIADP